MGEIKTTVIAGASNEPTRYAYKVAQLLKSAGHPFFPIGMKKGVVLGQDIQLLNDKPMIQGVHTITMYVGSQHQHHWEDYIMSLHPKRIIFNPGTENEHFMMRLKEVGIEVETACSLVLLSTQQY